MTIRQIVPLALMAVLVTAACGQLSASSTGSQAAGMPRIVPFSAFLDSVRSANYKDFAGRPSTKVPAGPAFAQMRTYLLDLYQGAHVVRSYTVGGAVFDCTEHASAQAHPPAPATAPTQSASAQAAGSQAGCPAGSVPVRRITMDDLVQFASLHQYLAKSPGGPGRLPPVPGSQ
ncbi:MAG: hypothetical protein ACRDNF_06650 [Streptosporangiaceae bacterium]